MKTITITAVVTLGLTFTAGPAAASIGSDDPCTQGSNAEMGTCYKKEQMRINAETDALANKIATEFRKEAQDPAMKGVVADTLRKAANTVKRSQQTWKVYRDQHCMAVAYSWTTGSGASTAYQRCLLHLGQNRLRELRSEFQ